MTEWLTADLTMMITGSTLGTVLALIFMVPETKREAIKRGVFTFGCGIVLGPWVGGFLGITKAEVGMEFIDPRSTITALIIWWVFGAFVRTSQLIQSTEKIDIVALLKIFKP